MRVCVRVCFFFFFCVCVCACVCVRVRLRVGVCASVCGDHGTQAHHQSQPSAVSGTPAMQSDDRCHQVPRLPPSIVCE